MLLASVTYQHFIYHPTWAMLTEQHVQKLDEIKIYKKIYDHFLTLECNLDHIALRKTYVTLQKPKDFLAKFREVS